MSTDTVEVTASKEIEIDGEWIEAEVTMDVTIWETKATRDCPGDYGAEISGDIEVVPVKDIEGFPWSGKLTECEFLSFDDEELFNLGVQAYQEKWGY